MARRRDSIQVAEKLVARGKLEPAIKEYSKVLKDNPSDTSTLNKVGDLYVRLKRLDEAIDLFRRAAEHFAREELYVKAIAIYKKIIRLEPTRIDVYETLADLYHRQGLVTEARAQYQVVSDYYGQSGDRGKVINIQERLVELEAADPTARVRLAELYCEAGRLQDAMAQYREIADFMISRDKVPEAVKVYSGAFELDTTDLEYLTDSLFHLKDAGYPEAALKLLDYAVERNPEATRAGSMAGLAEARGVTESEGPAGPLSDAAPAEPVATAPPAIEEEAETPAEPGEPEEPPEEGVDEPVEIDDRDREEILVELDVEETPALGPLEPQRPEPATDTAEIELDLSTLEAPPKNLSEAIEAEDAVASEAARVAELFTEARILSNYGLESKAIDLCEELLELDADHLEASALAARLYVSSRPERTTALAEQARELAGREDREEIWLELRAFLEAEGYAIDSKAVSAPETEQEPPIETPSVPDSADGPEIAEDAADERLDWLRSEASPAPDTSADELFGDEAEFFDLAAELEQELKGEDFLDAEFQPGPPEQSLEEIVEGFRKGVAETLSGEDYDTHYNLGIAYREMGLLDEAIGEFQLSAKDPRYLVECCSLLGACFLEKGFPDLASKWFERGLQSPHVTEKETLGLLYELGNLRVSTGEKEAALETFTEIYGINSNYRDVVARLEELKQAD